MDYPLPRMSHFQKHSYYMIEESELDDKTNKQTCKVFVKEKKRQTQIKRRTLQVLDEGKVDEKRLLFKM